MQNPVSFHVLGMHGGKEEDAKTLHLFAATTGENHGFHLWATFQLKTFSSLVGGGKERLGQKNSQWQNCVWIQACQVRTVNLKNKTARCSRSKHGRVRDTRSSASQDRRVTATRRAGPTQRKEGHYFTEEEEDGGVVVPNANVLEKLRSPV